MHPRILSVTGPQSASGLGAAARPGSGLQAAGIPFPGGISAFGLKSGPFPADICGRRFAYLIRGRLVSGIDRRTFLFLGLGSVLGGCMGTYWHGADEVEMNSPAPRTEEAAPAAPAETPAAPAEMSMPIYEDEGASAWWPDLRPIPRECWAVHPPRLARLRPMGRITRLTIHHEGSPQPNTAERTAEVAACLRLIAKIHVDQNLAGDIGYHYVIDRAGRIWEGRKLEYTGAHAGGDANDNNLGVMLLGNFDLQEPTERQKICLRAFVKLLSDRFGLGPRAILTHRELKPTRCPGDRLQEYVNRMRRTI